MFFNFNQFHERISHCFFPFWCAAFLKTSNSFLQEVVAKIDWSIKDQLTAKFAAVATFEKHESLATGKNGEVGNARISGDNRQKAEKGGVLNISNWI